MIKFWQWLCDLELNRPDYIYPDKRGFIQDAKNIERDFRTSTKKSTNTRTTR